MSHSSGRWKPEPVDGGPAPRGLATATRKQGKRKDNDQANRADSFLMHRFQSIFS
jgi:nitric oxide reductase NorD protein